MMVKCPECDADISNLADPCPKCGLPNAGSKSKEGDKLMLQSTELALLNVKKDPIGYFRNRYLDHFSNGEPNCPNSPTEIGLFTKIHKVTVKSCYIEKIEYKYCICIEFICNTCGKSWKHPLK